MRLLFTMRYLIRNLSLIQKTLYVRSGGKSNKNEYKKPNKNNGHKLPKIDKTLIYASMNVNKLQVK